MSRLRCLQETPINIYLLKKLSPKQKLLGTERSMDTSPKVESISSASNKQMYKKNALNTTKLLSSPEHNLGTTKPSVVSYDGLFRVIDQLTDSFNSILHELKVLRDSAQKLTSKTEDSLNRMEFRKKLKDKANLSPYQLDPKVFATQPRSSKMEHSVPSSIEADLKSTTRRKAGSGTATLKSRPNFNKQITDIFEELAFVIRNKGNIHKWNAYTKAAKILKIQPGKILSGYEALQLDGIGEKMAAEIDEILQSGKLAKLERELSVDNIEIVNLLSRVSGIGPCNASRFVYELGVRNLDDLRNVKLTRHQAIGLKYFEEFELRIPREEMIKHEKLLLSALKRVDRRFLGCICGSFRRGLPESGDIDMLIAHPDFTKASDKKSFDFLKKFVVQLRQKSYLTDDISSGNLKYST